MKRVAGTINLATTRIKVRTTKKTRTGSILLEVEDKEIANLLAQKIKEVVRSTARVRLPEMRTPIMLLDIPEWADVQDVRDGLERAGVPIGEDVNIVISRNHGGRRDLVARMTLPFRAAITTAEAKAIMVGWTRCRVRVMENKQPTCFRCQDKGHIAVECGKVPRPRRCHICSSTNHLARECRGPEEQPQNQQRQQKEQQLQQEEHADQEVQFISREHVAERC